MSKAVTAAFALALSAATVLHGATSGDENFNIKLWEPGKVPLATAEGPLDQPFLTVFLPPENKRNGSAVVIAPGGGNIMLMYGVEGLEIAERFNDWGTTAFVLTYRLAPKYKEDARVLDGNRAIRLVRSRAQEFKIDPNRIMFGGFSAGSTMARSVTAAATPGDPNAPDPVDRYDSKANLLLMVYGPGRPAPTEKLKEFPPTFLLAAAADAGAANGSAQFFMELNKAGAVAELHLYQRGRHGFGAATSSPEFGPWMDQLNHFLKLNHFFEVRK
jgi:acetyl esterase/lipase